jgi:DNA-directed RNA polymerase specialized sigma subunit
MARDIVDVDLVRRIITAAVGPHASLREARENGVYVMPSRDRAIELCMPLAPRTIERLTAIPWASRVEFADLEAAALQGIVEGVDRYQPRKLYKGKPIQVNTYLHLWIRKRVYEEVQQNHWAIMRPPRSHVEPYMQGVMSQSERETYIDTFLKPVIDHEARVSHLTLRGGEEQYMARKHTWDLNN